MPKFWAAYPHPAGVFQARMAEKEIAGETRDEVLKTARSQCPLDRYLSSIWTVGTNRMIWEAGSGWTEAVDEFLPR